MKISTKPTLLYVEDDLEIMQNTKFLLEDYFKEIYTSVDGEDAFEKFKKNKPDVILLDINIPSLNGIELAKKIRKLDNNIPILFLTAYCDKDKLMSAISIGTSSYIVKPFKMNELQDAIKKTIHKKGLSNEVELGYQFLWDRNSNTILYKAQALKLTKKEILLMNTLTQNKEKFFTACDLSIEILHENIKDSKCNNIVQLISRFKNKIFVNFGVEEFFIKSIYGMGYQIILKNSQ